ncbi:hypothetical protein FVER14953_21555 [Fusarium verticillioides]|nr:hypothetical protein FVER14953_21555 [Fusarium verticillioides]
MAGNFEEVAKQFVEFYYNTFDSDRKGLAALYVSGPSAQRRELQ